MSYKKTYVCEEKVEEKNKVSWISKIAKGIKIHKQKQTIHCNDYSSLNCLKCDKCWANNSKLVEKLEEE